MYHAVAVIVVASYPDATSAEASRVRLAEERIPAHVLPRVPGRLGRVFGFRERYRLGVAEADVAKAKAILG